MDDTISRQAAIDAVSEACFELRGVFGRCEDAIKALPSAQSERKEGRWEMEKEYLYLRACLYAINNIARKGGSEYAIKIDGKWHTIPWSEVTDWLIEQAEQKRGEKSE